MAYKNIEDRNAYHRARRARRRQECPVEASALDRSQKLRQRFNKSADWYAEQLDKQKHCCAVCNKPKEENNGFELSVDHDHKCCPDRNSCGKCVRGLLCNRCNRALGLLGDSVEILKKMIAYLQSYGDQACH